MNKVSDKVVRQHADDQTHSLSGRTYSHPSLIQAPVHRIPGTSSPVATGHGYWKTGFRNGSFAKTLYTYSTIKIVVGEDWTPDLARESRYNDDTHRMISATGGLPAQV